MNRSLFLFILFLNFFIITGISGACPDNSETVIFNLTQPDTLAQSQILYNGRVWQNLYYTVMGDQFLFSKVFLPGSLTIRGKSFKNVSIMYDLYKDEILTTVSPGGILQLNKEMVDSFAILFQNKTYHFTRMSIDGLKGYYNVIYKGKTALYVRYSKKIEKLAVEDTYDQFYQLTRIYFMKDNIAHLLTSKSDLKKVLVEEKELVKNFIKKNKLIISKENPESFVTVIRYFDSIRK
jgi:hypothetical protein